MLSAQEGRHSAQSSAILLPPKITRNKGWIGENIQFPAKPLRIGLFL